MLLDVFERSDEGKIIGDTAKALRSVFDKDALEELLRTELNTRLGDITLGDNFRKITLKVAETAYQGGWLPKLLNVAKEQRSANVPFTQECDRILSLRVASQEEAEPPPVAPRRLFVSIALTVGILVLASGWGLVLIGPVTLYYSLAGVAGWAIPNAVQVFWESEKIRRIDRILCWLLAFPAVTRLLAGLGAGGLIASLFVGAVEAPPAYADVPVSIATKADDFKGRPLEAGSRRLHGTVPWSGRTLTVWSAGYQPLQVTVCPWRRQRLEESQFQLAPYVLLAASNDLAHLIGNRPWKLEMQVDGEKRSLNKYRGEMVLLGDTRHQPSWVKVPQKYKGWISYERMEDGKPTRLTPPFLLRPGMEVVVVVHKWIETDQSFAFVEEPRTRRTITIEPPADRDSALQVVELSWK